MVGKSTHLHVISQQSTQNIANFSITDILEKTCELFYCSTRTSTLVSAIILLTQVTLQKFPFLFISIILCFSTVARQGQTRATKTKRKCTSVQIVLPFKKILRSIDIKCQQTCILLKTCLHFFYFQYKKVRFYACLQCLKR